MKSKSYILCGGVLWLIGCLYAMVAGWPFAARELAAVQDVNVESIAMLRSVKGFISEQRQPLTATGVPQWSRLQSPFVVSLMPVSPPVTPSVTVNVPPPPQGQQPSVPVKPTTDSRSKVRVLGTFGNWSADGAKHALVDGIVLTVGDPVRGGWTIRDIDQNGVTFSRKGKIMRGRIGDDVLLE